MEEEKEKEKDPSNRTVLHHASNVYHNNEGTVRVFEKGALLVRTGIREQVLL
jgi:hypothetical protein